MTFQIPLAVATMVALTWVFTFIIFRINLIQKDSFFAMFFNKPKKKIIGLFMILIASLSIIISYAITLYEYSINPSLIISSFIDGQYISGFFGDAIALPLLVLGFLIFFT